MCVCISMCIYEYIKKDIYICYYKFIINVCVYLYATREEKYIIISTDAVKSLLNLWSIYNNTNNDIKFL